MRILEFLAPYLLVASIGAVVSGQIVHDCAQEDHADEMVKLHNEMALKEGTIRTELGNWKSRALVAENNEAVAEAMTSIAREDAERWRLVARENHSIAVSYRNRLVGQSEARPDDAGGSVIPIELEDGSLVVEGEVRVGGVLIPAGSPIEVVLEVVLTALGIDVTILEDEQGLPHVLVSTDDPHVENVTIESVIDRRRTGVDEAPGPSRAKWFGIGVGAFAVLQALFGN